LCKKETGSKTRRDFGKVNNTCYPQALLRSLSDTKVFWTAKFSRFEEVASHTPEESGQNLTVKQSYFCSQKYE
jgi:hypothetical protein